MAWNSSVCQVPSDESIGFRFLVLLDPKSLYNRLNLHEKIIISIKINFEPGLTNLCLLFTKTE